MAMVTEHLKKIFSDINKCNAIVFFLLDIYKHSFNFNSHYIAKQCMHPLLLWTDIKNVLCKDETDWHIKVIVTVRNNLEIRTDYRMPKIQIHNYINRLLVAHRLCNTRLTNHIHISDVDLTIYFTVMPYIDDAFSIILNRITKKKRRIQQLHNNDKTMFVLFVYNITSILIDKRTLYKIFHNEGIRLITFDQVFPHEFSRFPLLQSITNRKRSYHQALNRDQHNPMQPTKIVRI